MEVGEEQGVQLACEVALEAAHDLLGAFALRGAPLGVGAGGGSMRRRVSAITHSALLAWRSSPRLSRWRTVLPEDASTGLTPHRAASAASEVRRSVVRVNCN